jgi:predicted patatin/cPLA2 family phospholipase
MSRFRASSSVLDLPHPSQSGLTIRVLETLSMDKKIITTSRFIKKHKFYNSDNIFILNKDLESDFNKVREFAKKVDTATKCDVDEYELGNWLNRLLSS